MALHDSTPLDHSGATAVLSYRVQDAPTPPAAPRESESRSPADLRGPPPICSAPI
ncbi:MAG: hypothetical protein ACTSRS_02615 [Candidatus Helarchaeota archaeon]